MEPKLGILLKDVVTGQSGIAVNRTDFLTGNVQFALQPVNDKDGKTPPTIGFDVHQLEVPTKGQRSAPVIPAPADTGITLGDKVRDIVTGVEGIAILRTTFLNGCVYYSVLTAQDEKREAAEYFTEYKRLEVIKGGIVAKIAKRVGAVKRATGGPVFNVPKRG